MPKYQIVIEGVFISLGGGGAKKHGFYSTFFVESGGAPSAVMRVRDYASRRMRDHGVEILGEGIFRSYFYVKDIWEISEGRFEHANQSNDGFSFFRISFMEKFSLLVRYCFIKKFRPQFLIDIPVPVRQ